MQSSGVDGVEDAQVDVHSIYSSLSTKIKLKKVNHNCKTTITTTTITLSVGDPCEVDNVRFLCASNQEGACNLSQARK